GALLLAGCDFERNGASGAGGWSMSYNVLGGGAGGGLFSSGSVALQNCSFRNNFVNGSSGGGGGASMNDAQVIDCLFLDNSAYCGGGAYVWGSSGGGLSIGSEATVINCVFAGNQAVTGQADNFNPSYGGGLDATQSATL